MIEFTEDELRILDYLIFNFKNELVVANIQSIEGFKIIDDLKDKLLQIKGNKK